MSWSNQAGSSSRSLPAGAAAQREEEEKENGGEGMACDPRTSHRVVKGWPLWQITRRSDPRTSHQAKGLLRRLKIQTSSSEDTPVSSIR